MQVRLLALSLLIAGAAAAQVPVRYARHPALSPDGSQVVFEWCGDLFVAPTSGGAARAITVHHADDDYPCFTRDGQWIIFASNRSGNWDIFRVRPAGGEPVRLTFYGGTDIPWGVTPENQVLFQSSRFSTYGQRFGPPMLIGLDGGTPWRLLKCSAGAVSLSPDGRRVAFVHKRSTWEWRGYKGGGAEDIWVGEVDGTFTKVTDYSGPDVDPLWSADGQTLYFTTDRVGRHNLWRMPAGGGEASQLTQHEQPIREPSISADGSAIVYWCDDDLWLFETAAGASRKLELTGPRDRLEPEVLYEQQTSGIGEYKVAPSGKEVAFVVRGDIYCCRFPDGGPTTQLTNTPEDEGGLAWSEDSKTLYFHSDRFGQYDLFSLTSGDEAEPRLRRTGDLKLTRLTETEVDEVALQFSPDFKRVSYTSGYGDIVVANPDLSEPKVLFASASTWGVTWSPDSRWLAFVQNDQWSNSDVWLVSAEGGPATNVSQHPDGDGEPVFSGDMKRLAFVSSRFDDQNDIFYVWLNQADWQMPSAEREWLEDDAFDKPEPPAEEAAEGEGEAAEESEESEAEEEAKPPAPVDLDDIHERMVRFTFSGDHSERGLVSSPDGKRLAWIDAAGDLVASEWDSLEPRALVAGGGGGFEWTPDGRSLRFVRGGRVSSQAASGGSVTTVDHSARIERNLAEERAYVFEKAWMMQRDYFYDENMHGADWAAAREFYRPRALGAPTRAAFADVMNRLIGEIGASHQGFSTPGRSVSASGPPAASLGIVWTDERSGTGLVVESIERDSPADRAPDGPLPGERVLSINDVALAPGVNEQELLIGQIGERIALEIAAADGTQRTAWLRGFSAGQISGQRYNTWRLQNRDRILEQSGGRIGYLHVPGMSPGGVEQFQRDLQASAGGKDAVVVDVRFNGGGGSFDFILSSIVYRPYVYNTQRGRPEQGFPTGWLPVPVFRGPAAAMWNEGSGSGAEIFGHAWRYLEVGPSSGWPSWGGVIGTGGTGFVDGSFMRLPVVGYYNLDGTNQEGNPAQPEIIVDITPNDELTGRDPQVEAAVSALLAIIGPAG